MKGVIVFMIAASLFAVPLVMEMCSAESPFITVEQVSDRTFRFTAPASGTWDTGDGGIYTGTAAVHTFSVSGLHRVTFTSGDSVQTVSALVIDREPVTEAATGVMYNYCPGIVGEITTDCPGLFWNPGTMSLTGIPAALGSFTVTVGSGSFQLTVTAGAAQIDRSFDMEIDGPTVRVKAASAGMLGIQYTWRIIDASGRTAAVGHGPEQVFTLNAEGDYIITCTLTDSYLQTSTYSRQFTIALPEDPSPEEKKGFEMPLWGWFLAGGIGILVLRRVLV